MAFLAPLAPVIAGIGSAVAIGGTLLSYNASKQAAEAQSRLDSFNKVVSMRNIETERQTAQLNQMFQIQEINQNRALNEAQHQMLLNQVAWADYDQKLQQSAADSNMKNLENEAAIVESQSREAIRRRREQGMRIKAEQTAKFAGSGVSIGAGSPLAVLADTAGLVALDIADIGFEANVERTGILYKRDLTKWNADVAAESHQFSKAKMLSEGNLAFLAESSRLNLAKKAADTELVMAERGAAMKKWATENSPSTVPAMKASATAGLVSGISSNAGSIAEGYRNGNYG